MNVEPTTEFELSVERTAEAPFAPVICSPSGRTHLDLFSGIGGFAIAAQRAGYSTIGFSEIEPYACKILKRHWPHVTNYGDIRNIGGVRADLLTGGFPCQPFSKAGKRRGKEDDRYLWPEMCRVIDEANPRFILAENVPGVISLALDEVLNDLEARGYSCGAFVVPACGVDAPQWRERVWVVAIANNGGCLRGQHEIFPAKFGVNDQRKSVSGCDPLDIPTGLQNLRGWPAEPELGRVAHGIPNRAHRLRGLGNAIVPQVAETLIRMMARMENSDYPHPSST